MYIRSMIVNLASRSLYESLPIDIMVRLVNDLIPGYDIYRRTGIPENIPIQGRDAAGQIMRDVISSCVFLPLIESIITVSTVGLNGRQYPVPLVGEIAKELAKDGIHFDKKTRLFIETPGDNATPNWRRLRPGVDSQLTLLRFDMVGNTRIVRNNPPAKIKTAFADYRKILSDAVKKRNGRLWCTEGDGGIAAYHYGQRDMEAALSGMEVIHELFLYNRLSNVLTDPLQIRIAIHNGPMRWSFSEDELQKNDLFHRVKEMESKMTLPGSITVSPSVFDAFERSLASRFTPLKMEKATSLRNYAIRLEGKA